MNTEKQKSDGYIASLCNQLNQPGNTDVDNLIAVAVTRLNDCSQSASPETASSLLEKLAGFQSEKTLPLVKALLKKVTFLNYSGLRLIFKNWPEAATCYNADSQYSDKLWTELNELVSENTEQFSRNIRSYIREKSGYYQWNIRCSHRD